MPDIDGFEVTWRIRADGRSPGRRSRHDRQRLAGRPAKPPGGGHERPWRSRSTRSAWCFACSVISAGAAPWARRQRQRTRRTRRGVGDITVGWRQPELIVQVLWRFPFRTCRTLAQLERQLGEGDVRGSAATCRLYHQGHSLAPAPAGRASELEQVSAPRRSAARYGNPRRILPRRTAYLKSACCSACKRCSAHVAESAS